MANEDEEVASVLKTLDDHKDSYIMTQSRSSIKGHKNDMLQKLQIKKDELKNFHEKLEHYMYVDDLSNIRYGGYIRWIRLTDPENIKLTNGGFILDIKIYETGCNILCKNNMNRKFEIKFDENMIFQKLTPQEEVLLDVLTYLEK